MDTNTNKRKIESVLGWLVLLVAPVLFGINIAGAITQYPPGSLLQPSDVTSTHIRNNEIVDADVNTSANIGGRKVAPNGTTGTVLLTDGTNIATTTGLKFATSTADLYVFTGRVHATSTNFNGVNYTWPSADGAASTILQTNGSGTLSWAQSSPTNLQTSFTAGSAVTAGNAVFIAATSSDATTTVMALSSGAYVTFGATAANGIAVAQSFNDAGIFNQLGVRGSRSAGAAGDVVLSVRADSAGVPGNTVLASCTISNASWPTANSNIYCDLNTTIINTSGTTLWVMASSTGAQDDANNFTLAGASTNPYSGGQCDNYKTSWAIVTADAECNLVVKRSLTVGRVYPASATEHATSNGYVGIAQSTATIGNSVSVVYAGADTQQSSLTPGLKAYLSDTYGAISTTAGTISTVVGRALNTTTLNVFNNN